MKSVSKRWAAIAVCMALFVVSGCSSAPSVKDDKELNSLVEALVKNSEDVKKKASDRLEKGIRTLKVDKDGKVSADLDQASLPEVVRRMFAADTKREYVLEDVELRGRVSAYFNRIPFMNALNRLIKPMLLTAQVGEDGLIAIRSATDTKTEEPKAKIYLEVPLRNMDTESAINLLNGLFGGSGMLGGGGGGGADSGAGGGGGGADPGAAGGAGGADPGAAGGAGGPSAAGAGGPGAAAMGMGMPEPELKYGALPTANAIFLRGTSKEVGKASQMLFKADRETQHVVIEVLIVEYKTDALQQIGTKLQSFADGRFKDVNVDFFTKGAANQISFTQLPGNLTNNLTQFTGMVNMMVSTNKARLISRPYISTLSGKEAKINITSDRYVIVSVAGGASSTQSIQAGVILTITPTVLAGGNLRMAVNVEDSQFSDIVPANISTEVSKNAANTTMQVEDGQTVIIGGMVMNRRTWGNSGLPWIRNVPILKWLFGREDEQADDKEVVIYVTPHIWKPDMLSPIIDPDAMTIKEDKGVSNFIKSLK